MSSVETHSSELKKELGLADLVPQQIVYVVGVVVGTNLSDVVGPGGEWLASNKIFLMALNVFLIRRPDGVVAMPAFTLLRVNVFGKMAMGALSGFEWC